MNCYYQQNENVKHKNGLPIGKRNLLPGVRLQILLIRLLLVIGCLDLFFDLLLFWRIPSTQQGRPNYADSQNNIQLMTNGHEIEVNELHRYPENPLRLIYEC